MYDGEQSFCLCGAKRVVCGCGIGNHLERHLFLTKNEYKKNVATENCLRTVF